MPASSGQSCQPQSKTSYTHCGNRQNEFPCAKHALQWRAYSGKGLASHAKIGETGALARPAERRSAAVAAAPKGSKMHMPREKQAATQEQPLVRFGLGLANWSERWFPEPLIFALIGIVVVFGVGLLLHQSPAKLAIQGGKNFWTLVPFTMQMVMIIIGGYVVASTPIVYRAIRALAGIPKTPRQAVALVALFSMLTSLISWGL